MIRLIYIIILACLATQAYSQDDAIAGKILDEFSDHLDTYQTVKAKFTFTDINLREDIRDSYEGEITFKGDMFRLNILDTETWFNGKTLWNYLPDVNEVNVTEPDQEDDVILNNPFHALNHLALQQLHHKYIKLKNELQNNDSLSINLLIMVIPHKMFQS